MRKKYVDITFDTVSHKSDFTAYGIHRDHPPRRELNIIN